MSRRSYVPEEGGEAPPPRRPLRSFRVGDGGSGRERLNGFVSPRRFPFFLLVKIGIIEHGVQLAEISKSQFLSKSLGFGAK